MAAEAEAEMDFEVGWDSLLGSAAKKQLIGYAEANAQVRRIRCSAGRSRTPHASYWHCRVR